MVEAIVSEDEAVAAHLPRVDRHARKLSGVGDAEYDDLYQEGSIAVLLALREGRRPSDEEIRSSMVDWVRKCRRWRRQEPMEEDKLDLSGVHSSPGRKKVFWNEDDGVVAGGWSELIYAPE